LVPLGEFESSLDQCDKNREYVVHCKLGGRSAKAVQIMKNQGFSKVSNLVGGINAWAEEIDPSMPVY
jgi:adenylyltransferase/sulfurtransferase